VAIYEDDFNFLSKMCLTRMRDVAWQIMDEARRHGAKVVVHGSDASDHAEEYLRHGADYVLLGEAEITLSDVCRAILIGRDPGCIAGLLKIDVGNNQPIRSAPTSRVTNWHTLPRPARDLIDIKPYRDAWTAHHGYFSLNLVASRGCPYRCNWCAKPISGDRFHVRAADAVVDEIQELKNVYGADHLWFGDDVFALNHHWVRQFATELKNKGCALPFKIQSRADLMTAETVEALQRAGCVEVWMGVESGSQKILDAMNKGLRIEEVVAARQLLADAGIRACYFLQLGYPGESWREIQETASLVRATRPDDIGVSVSYPLPNTRFYEQVQEEQGGKRNWLDSEDLCVMFKAGYSDDFYRAIRDALHAEVDSWCTTANEATRDRVDGLWREIRSLEPASRNPDATHLISREPNLVTADSEFVPLQRLSQIARGA
jgi:anaerobic magnesium-protoporphyrin IX monomethyl ester cyclase